MKKALFLLPVILLSGCSLWKKPAPDAPGHGEPIRVEMEITERAAAPAPEPPPAPMPKKQKAKVAPAPAPQKRVELPEEYKKRGGLDGELNSVERSYLDGIRERNKRTREENASKVFGGWGL